MAAAIATAQLRQTDSPLKLVALLCLHTSLLATSESERERDKIDRLPLRRRRRKRRRKRKHTHTHTEEDTAHKVMRAY